VVCCRALVGATDADGRSIFSGKAATGFSNVEEEEVGMVNVGDTLVIGKTI
jgi:hypothetical protein